MEIHNTNLCELCMALIRIIMSCRIVLRMYQYLTDGSLSQSVHVASHLITVILFNGGVRALQQGGFATARLRLRIRIANDNHLCFQYLRVACVISVKGSGEGSWNVRFTTKERTIRRRWCTLFVTVSVQLQDLHIIDCFAVRYIWLLGAWFVDDVFLFSPHV